MPTTIGADAAATTTGSPSDTVEPCAVITEADVAASLGSDPGPGLSTPEPWGGQCNYDDGTVILNVLTGHVHLGGKIGYDTYLAGAQKGKNNDTSGRSVFQMLTGIGEAAFVSGGGPIAAAALYVGDTTVTLTIALADMTSPTPIAQATALATIAATRVG